MADGSKRNKQEVRSSKERKQDEAAKNTLRWWMSLGYSPENWFEKHGFR